MNIKTVPGKKIKKIQSIKAGAPGVPPNTCPYIDLTITMIQDLCESYDRLRTKGEHNPMTDRIQTHAVDTLELIRNSNETLRNNSLFWYEQYKGLDYKYKYHINKKNK